MIFVDAETDGLYGPVIAIGAVDDVAGDGFFARLPDEVVTDPWVRENVLPALPVGATHLTQRTMLADFALWWTPRRAGGTMADCGSPVESGLFRTMVLSGVIRLFDGPFPLHELATIRLMAGMDDTTSGPDVGIPPDHNPLTDAKVSAAQYRMLTRSFDRHPEGPAF